MHGGGEAFRLGDEVTVVAFVPPGREPLIGVVVDVAAPSTRPRYYGVRFGRNPMTYYSDEDLRHAPKPASGPGAPLNDEAGIASAPPPSTSLPVSEAKDVQRQHLEHAPMTTYRDHTGNPVAITPPRPEALAFYQALKAALEADAAHDAALEDVPEYTGHLERIDFHGAEEEAFNRAVDALHDALKAL